MTLLKKDINAIYLAQPWWRLWDRTKISSSTSWSSWVIDSVNAKFTRTSFTFWGGNWIYSIWTDNWYPAVFVTSRHWNCNVWLISDWYDELIRNPEIKIEYSYFRIGSSPSSYTNSMIVWIDEWVYLNSSWVHTYSKWSAFTLVNDWQYSLTEEITTSDMFCKATLKNLQTWEIQETTYTKQFVRETSSSYILTPWPDIIRATRDDSWTWLWFWDISIYYYKSIVPVSAVYVKRPEPEPKKWTPWENTLVYMPLNWDVKDYSWNNNNGTITWEVSLTGTIWDKNYAEFNGWAIDLTTLPVSWNQTFTHSAWMKINSSWVSHMHHFGRDYNNSRSNIIIWYSNDHRPLQDIYVTNIYMWNAIPTSWYWTWKHCVYVHDWSSNKMYINWELYWEWSGNINIVTWYNKYIGRIQTNSIQMWYWMSESIIENRAWTKDEIQYYFNSTKADYWQKPHNLPLSYQEVEYIESSGTQWIDTWIIPKHTTKSQIKFKNLATTWDVIYWMSSWDDSADYRLFNYNSTCYFDMWSSRINWWTLSANVEYELELWNYYVKNMKTWTNIISWSTVSSYTWWRAITLNNHSNTYYSRNVWYYVKIYDWDTLVRDFVPCYRKSDNEIWMYDLVERKFYTNSWSGSFVKWDNVAYSPLIQIRPENKLELYDETNFGSSVWTINSKFKQSWWGTQYWTYTSYDTGNKRIYASSSHAKAILSFTEAAYDEIWQAKKVKIIYDYLYLANNTNQYNSEVSVFLHSWYKSKYSFGENWVWTYTLASWTAFNYWIGYKWELVYDLVNDSWTFTLTNLSSNEETIYNVTWCKKYWVKDWTSNALFLWAREWGWGACLWWHTKDQWSTSYFWDMHVHVAI